MALWTGRKQSVDPNRLRGNVVPGNPTGPFEPPPQQMTAYSEPPPGYPITNPIGWAPKYERPTGDPSTRFDDYYPPGQPPEVWYQRRDHDKAWRHSVETQDADGWTEQKGGSGYPAAPNPRSVPPPEDRPTMKMAPRSYSFTRPFDQWNRQYGDSTDAIVNSARQLNGTHFSMASFRRDYPILGMEPPRRSMRNTYRLTPAPWDTNLVDMPPISSPENLRIQSMDVPAASRSYRLG